MVIKEGFRLLSIEVASNILNQIHMMHRVGGDIQWDGSGYAVYGQGIKFYKNRQFNA
jgi:hypothetical protein